MKNFTTLIKETFGIYKEKIKPILALIAISIATAIIFGLSFASLLAIEMMDQAGASMSHLVIEIILFGIILLTMVCFMFIGLSFLICVIKPAGTKLKEIFKEAWKKLWQYYWIMILMSFFVILSFFFLIIPGIIVAVYLMFSSYILILEGEKGMNALKRSWSLVKGNWWKVFGRIILLNIIFSAIFILLDSVSTFLGFVFQSLGMPLSIIFTYLIYLELKKSKEIQAPTPIQVQESI